MDEHALFLKLGEINGQLTLVLSEQRQQKEELRGQISAMERRIAELEKGLRPIEEWQDSTELRIAALAGDLARTRDTVAKGAGVATVLVTLLGFAATGFWWAVWHWSEVLEFLRSGLGGGAKQ